MIRAASWLAAFAMAAGLQAAVGDTLEELKGKYGESRQYKSPDAASGLPLYVFKKGKLTVGAVLDKESGNCVKITYAGAVEKFGEKTAQKFMAANRQDSHWGSRIAGTSVRELVSQAEKERDQLILEARNKGTEMMRQARLDAVSGQKKLILNRNRNLSALKKSC